MKIYIPMCGILLHLFCFSVYPMNNNNDKLTVMVEEENVDEGNSSDLLSWSDTGASRKVILNFDSDRYVRSSAILMIEEANQMIEERARQNQLRVYEEKLEKEKDILLELIEKERFAAEDFERAQRNEKLGTDLVQAKKEILEDVIRAKESSQSKSELLMDKISAYNNV